MSEYTGGIDEEIGVEEKEKSDKITSIEEKKPKRRPFHYWEVGDRRLSLKLNTRMIEILENKYKMNIMNLVAGGDIPPLSVMIGCDFYVSAVPSGSSTGGSSSVDTQAEIRGRPEAV